MEKVAIVIPARYQSKRFPGKPLVKIGDITMIERVYRQCMKVPNISKVCVATDNRLIFEEVERFGNAMMTSSSHQSGTDRLVEASEKIDADIFINVQGDEPFIPPEMISEALEAVLSKQDVCVGTLRSSFSSPEEVKDPNIVKVVVDKNDFALYFSRAVIPYPRDSGCKIEEEQIKFYNRHVGIYVYRKEFLVKFKSLPESYMENIEKLEQLRILQSGFRIKAPYTSYHSPGVDTPLDIEHLKNYSHAKAKGPKKLLGENLF